MVAYVLTTKGVAEDERPDFAKRARRNGRTSRMIATVSPGWQPEGFCGEAAVKLRSLVAAYGVEAPFLKVYSGDNTAFTIMDGDAVLCGNSDEARLFLTMDPSVRRVRTDEHNARLLADMWQTEATCGNVMTPGCAMTADAAVTAITPREYWPVIETVFGDTLPPFDAWYADVSHRWRHGLSRLMGIYENGEVAAVAMTTAEDSDAMLIGAVATLPAYRGKGYAGKLVTTLAAIGQAEGKTVWLSPKNERAEALYTRLGFVSAGRFGQVTR